MLIVHRFLQGGSARQKNDFATLFHPRNNDAVPKAVTVHSTRRSKALAICAALALVMLGATAKLAAAPVTFDFAGTVTQIPVLDPADPFGGTIVVGSAISGSYTFDSLTLDSIPLDPQTASYQHTGPPYGATATIGGNTFSTTDSLVVNVANLIVANIDQYGVLACSPNQGSCMTGTLTIELFFQDNQGTTFLTDTQPLVPPPLANFEIRDFHLYQNTFDSTGALIAQVQRSTARSLHSRSIHPTVVA